LAKEREKSRRQGNEGTESSRRNAAGKSQLRSSRGAYWVEDSCSATTVRPNSSAITVTIVPAIPISNVRASSEVP